VGIKRTRHAVPVALFGDLVAVIATIIVCRWLFA
jgi:spore maturation protein B